MKNTYILHDSDSMQIIHRKHAEGPDSYVFRIIPKNAFYGQHAHNGNGAGEPSKHPLKHLLAAIDIEVQKKTTDLLHGGGITVSLVPTHKAVETAGGTETFIGSLRDHGIHALESRTYSHSADKALKAHSDNADNHYFPVMNIRNREEFRIADLQALLIKLRGTFKLDVDSTNEVAHVAERIQKTSFPEVPGEMQEATIALLAKSNGLHR